MNSFNSLIDKVLKGSKLTYHLVFWLAAYLFWVFIFRNNTLVITHAITIQFCYLVFIAANYYFNSLYAIPQLLNKKKYVVFVLCFLSAIVITAVLRVPVSAFVYRYVFKITNNHFDYLMVFYNSFINILFWVVAILTGKMIADKIRSQRYIEKIESERAFNELNFLRAQFNPHFLFNSINSIYGHIDKSNKIARDMLLMFSEMLRYQLYECNVDQIEVERELNYIKNYIALQKSRMDERVVVNFLATNMNGNIKIAPLLLITFIENAFKYVGFNEYKENRVDITLNYDRGALFFTIFNTKDTFISSPEKSSGLGIANTKRRLELIYPNEHLLAIDNNDEGFGVHLTLLKV
ncbi:sensor histidine kinase [Mucilaginibacter sp. X4EP1]|uniref:sensor histidine kinase n=1 Tax=Mucilaginibacter sp. X4EP1 TaxID=2723092 RepID=UPI002168F52C|nr:sensor histidine kinase [Mucilaginibacter sp. X4EP1]MCS3814050.1 sensor histidine kinase YesM [Mucilaginibacter sp. X4EP1]